MEGNTNWNPNGQGGHSLAHNANDWRSQHDPGLRKRVTAKVVEKLKEYYPKRCPDERQNEIYNSAAKFEDRIYSEAKNKDDYLLKLSEKMHMMEKTCQNNKHLVSSVNATNTPNPAAQVVNQAQSLQTSLPYTQNSRSQQRLPQYTKSNLNITTSSCFPNQVPINVSVAHAQNVNIHIGEGVQINLIPGTQRQMQGRQQLIPQQQQLLKENNHHGNLRPPHMQQQSQPPPQQQHPQSLLKQPIQQSSSGQQNSQLQPENQFSTQLVRSNHHQQHMATQFQKPEKQEHDRLFSQLVNKDAQQSYQAMAQQSNNIQNTHQQCHNSSALPSQQQQNMCAGGQSGNFIVPRSSFMVTQGRAMGQTQQMMLQQYQPQYHHAEQPQNRSLPQHLGPGKNVTQRFQTDQLIQQFQFERPPLANPSTSQDSTCKTENVNGGNWQEETYQKIKAMKEKYLHILSGMYQRVTDKLRQNESRPQLELLEKLKLAKSILARIIMFLNLKRNTISENHRDSFDQYERQILRYVKNHQTELQKQMQSSQSHYMNSQLMPSNPNMASSLVSMHHSLQTTPKIKPRDDNSNIMASSGNVVLPSLIQNHRQMQQQPLHRKQQQQERQENLQLQIPNLQQKKEINDVRMKQEINNKAELLQQHLSSSPRKLLKPMASSGRMSNLSPLPSSLRIVDEGKSGTPLQSDGSPFVSQSPMTSFAPSPVPGDLEKPISVESPVEIGTKEQSPPLSVKSIAERPIDRLIKAYQSSSQKNLAESVSEIRAVVNMVDRIAGSFHPSGLGEDLSARLKFPFLAHGETNPSKRMKRTIMPRDVALQTDTYDVGSMDKIEPRFALLQEIKEINERLIETVVEICDEVTSGTIVACSYSPVAVSATYKAHYMSGKISQIQPLRVVIPANYPNSSPILLEEISLDASVHIYEDLSARTRSRFSLSMKELSDPASLKEIAKMWNDCARATMAEYAERHGGGTFSSKYGPWETVLGASCT